ncbi:MAG: hypothetical protein IJN18_01430, partial [Clostridia bacterium]|nr:hypothetical protein [Clostridia bacterium]
SDTFTIREEDLSWYSQPNADREYYISDFTLTEDSNTLYLRANMPEGWWVEDNISTGWEDEDGNWYPHGGCETIRDIRWLDNGFFRITLDPETAQINYGRRSFGLDPQLHCKSQWGHDEMWGTGIHVENCLPYLTARSIDRNENGELVPSDSHAEDGMRTNPTQERFRVYYLNVLENDRWTEYPVQPELHFFEEDLGGCVWLRKSEEPDSGDIVSEYGHFLGVNSDAWGHSFAIRGSYGDHTGFMWVDVARDHVNFYSSPNPTADTYIDSFALNDLSGGNVFYVGAEDDWKIESVSTTWADGDESGCYENADLVTVTRVTDRAWKITVDAEGVRQRFGHDGFELELRVESKRGEDYDGRNLRIYIQNNLPFLRYAWLENDGGGWYLPVYDNGLRFEDGFGMFPEDSFYHIYALTYYDRMGIETTVPVIPTVSQGSVTVETVLGRGESVEDRQEYADSFVVLTSAANSWDTPVTLKAFAAGHTACMDVYIGRGEAEIYSSATDISNATVLKEFYKDPMNTARNVFWLAIEKETDWAKLAENSVQLQQTNLAALGEMTEVGDYYVWPVTLTEAGTKAPETFRLFVDYTWLENNEEQRQHFRTRDIWVSPGEIEGRVARFWVNFNEYFFVDAGQSDGSTLAYTWTENGVGQAEIPGLSYNSMTNTITLTDARLQQLDISAEDLPNADVTLALVGGSTITGGARGPALFLHGGVNLTITAEDKASLDISSTNTVNDGTDATDPWAHPALHLWENGDGNLTVTGNASVTLTVNGEEYEWSENDQYEETEEGQRIPAHMNAIGGNVGSKGTLTVSGNAVLVITPPEHPLDRWSGIEGFKTIELRDSAVLNTSRLDLHGEQESFLRVLDNSTLSVGMTGDDNGSDYYFGGIYIENGYLTIAGGTVNVTAPAFTTDKHLYTTGISLHSGSFGFVAGSLNIDLSGFGVTPNGSSEWINGCGLQLGDSEDFTHSVKWGVDGGETIINLGDNCATGVQLCANASADLQKGSLTVNG